MEMEFVWITVFVLITIIQQVLSYQTYVVECGQTIKLDQLNPAAKLIVYNESDCYVTIRTEPGFRIAYTLDNPGSYDPESTSCVFYVSFNDFVSGVDFCFDSPMISHDGLTSNEDLMIHIVGDMDNVPSFNIMFVSVRSPSCRGSEVLCPALFGSSRIPEVCLDYSLLCHEAYPYCTEINQACSDISSHNPANLSYTYIIAGIAGLFVIGAGVLMTVFRYKKRGQSLGGSRSASRDVRTRAMAIFSTQLAARGVDSADGNVIHLDAEGNPIDFSKFDPPPEYSSLEHLDTVGVTNNGMSLDDEEPPPGYDHVMKNRNDFSITNDV